jgi:AcrR family transcriptional regulator
LQSASRPQRSDARHNQVSLLDAAKDVFTSHGVDAPAKQITDVAGVGVGTLYRHYPRRSDLIIAVMQHEIDECIAFAGELERSAGSWDAVTAWIDRFQSFVATKHGFAAALHSGDPAYEGLPERLLGQLVPAFGRLLDRAAAEGLVRSDVDAREVVTTVALLCQPVPSQPADFSRRMAGVFLAGLLLSPAG